MATPVTTAKSASPQATAENEAESPGFIVLDRTGEPLYLNSAAQQILGYANSVRKMDIKSMIRDHLRSDVKLLHANRDRDKVFWSSGRREYVCSVFALEPLSRRLQSPMTGIVLTRNSCRAENLRRACEQYKLTPREREAVLLLSKGLTSKEIARRMEVSAHTVKAFLRLIMLKLGVSTRSGIVGKITSQNTDRLVNNT